LQNQFGYGNEDLWVNGGAGFAASEVQQEQQNNNNGYYVQVCTYLMLLRMFLL
jgi:hypothetical protein